MPTSLNIQQSLSILLWNANGLNQQKNELKAFLQLSHVDIILISEAHLTLNSSFKLPGYITYHCDHPSGNAHAGSAIIIQSNLKHSILPSYQSNSIQATNIKIILNHIPTTISSAYFPPQAKLNSNELTNFLLSIGNNYLIGGDFNCKHTSWGSRITNTRGRILHNVIQNKNLKFLSPPNPTYWPTHQNRQPDILDFFITNLPNHINRNISNLSDLSSDHTPVLLSLNDHVTLKTTYPTLTPGKINWQIFSESVESQVSLNISLKNHTDIDNAVLSLTDIIKNSASRASHTHSPKTKQDNLPLHLSQLLTEKRRARARWQRTHLPSDKSTYNRLSCNLKNLLYKYNTESYQHYINSLTNNNKSLWKATKNILKEKKVSPPLRNPNNTLAISNSEKANLFATHLANNFRPHSDINIVDHTRRITESLDTPCPMALPTKHTSPSEILFLIKKLQNNKSPGHDLITNKIIKHLPKKAIIQLTYIFNSILRLSYIPQTWKHSIVILIHKPGKPPELPSSYRPISLLPSLSKILEKIILKRIYSIVNESKIIPNTQFGFKNKHSTLHQIHRLTDIISSSLEIKNHCEGVFLDVAQAFDRVWTEGLLYKLRILPAPLYLTLKSFLSQRTFAVRCDVETSNIQSINAGIPQGSILAPTLYNIFTSDIPHSNNTHLATFADDTAILSSNPDSNSSTKSLQDHLNNLQTWFKLWRIKINEEKSTHVSFTLRSTNGPPLSINNNIIPQHDYTKYLGIHLDKKLNWAYHIKNKRKSLNLRLHSLRHLLRSNMPLNTKLLIYKQIIRPAMTYGIQIWGSAKKSNISILQSFQSINLRIITGAPWYVSNQSLHKDLRILTLPELASCYFKKFHRDTQNHPNPLISNLHNPSNPINPLRRLKRNWARDLL